MGGKILLKSGNRMAGHGDSDEDDDEDDDQLLLSIQKKLGTIPLQGVESQPQLYDSEEDDDDKILHSVEKMYNRPLEIAPFIQKQSNLPNLIEATGKLSGKEVPSPYTNSSSGDIVKEGNTCTCLSDPGQDFSDISESASIENGRSSPRVSSPDLDGDITPTKSVLQVVAAEHLGHVTSDEGCGHELDEEEERGLIISGLPELPGQFDGRPETSYLEHGEMSVTLARADIKRTTIKLMHAPKEMALVAFKPPLHLLGRPVQFEDASVENFAADPAESPFICNSSEGGVSIEDALQKNRACANMLRNLLLQNEKKQEENKELQRRMRTLIDFEKSCKRRFAGLLTHTDLPMKLFMTSEPTHRKSGTVLPAKLKAPLEPPHNEDVEDFQKLQREFPSGFDVRKWTKRESEELKKGVKQQLQEILVRQTMEALIMSQNSNDDPTCLDDFMKEVAGRSFTDTDFKKYFPSINWDLIARRYVPDRSAAECRIRWLNHEDGLRNHTPWTKAEDKRLLHLAQQHDLCNWESIAEELGTNRTAAQCLIRYQRSLNPTIMRSSWTPEEDQQLRAAVEIHGEKNWQAVAANIEGRTGSQCGHRWHKVVHPGRHSGRWSMEEDKLLTWSVCLYGSKQWNMIATHVPGRTDVQCRERWCNVLDPVLKHEDWSEQEDKRLEEAVEKYGTHRWALVATELKTRTDNQCWRRWKVLKPEHQAAFKNDVYIRRVALVANFSGRKHERPSLSTADFIPDPSQVEKQLSPTERRNSGTNSVQEFRPSASAKASRTERIRKMRLSRAEGRLKAIARVERVEQGASAKESRSQRIREIRHSQVGRRLTASAREGRMDEGALSKLVSSTLPLGHSMAIDSDQAPLPPNNIIQSLALDVQGATFFVSMVRSIANLCNFLNDPDMPFENDDKEIRFLDTGDQAGSSKSGVFAEKDHNRGWLGKCSVKAPTQEAKDEEVAAATRTVLSWPFFLGLQKFWNQGLEDPIFPAAENLKKVKCHEAHDFLSNLQFVNRRKRTTYHRPRRKKLLIFESVLMRDQGVIEASKMPARNMRDKKKPKTRTSTLWNPHKNKTQDDPVKKPNTKLSGSSRKSANRGARFPDKCTEDPCIVLNSSKKRKPRSLMDISNVASKRNRAS